MEKQETDEEIHRRKLEESAEHSKEVCLYMHFYLN